MAYGDRYYALDPTTGQWYTTDAQGNQLYNTPLPTVGGQPVDPATGIPLQWNATSFKPSQNATSADPLTGTPAQQDPVTSGQPAPQQAPTPSDGKPPVRVQGPDVQISLTGNPTSTGTQTTTYPAPTSGTGGVTYVTDATGKLVPFAGAVNTPYSRTRYVRWADGGFPSEDSAKGYLYQLRQTAPDQYAAIVNRMERAGWDVSSPSKVQANWENVVGKAADSYDSGYKDLDPFVAIDLYSDLKGVKQGQGPEASVVSNIKLSSRSDARGALVASYQNLLGRDPSSKEVNAFTAALNSLEKSSPTTTTTVAAPSPSGISYDGQNIPATQTSSVQTGGFDSGQYSIDTAKSANDYAEYQAETTFMNALLSAIQSPVNI